MCEMTKTTKGVKGKGEELNMGGSEVSNSINGTVIGMGTSKLAFLLFHCASESREPL